MKIIRISVLLNQHADICLLTTDLPSSMPKVDDSNLYLKFEAEKNTGVEYCKKHFPEAKIFVING